MDRIEKRKIYLDYLDSLNESKARNKKIDKAKEKIHKFLKKENVIDWIIEKVVSEDSSKGVKYLVWFADAIKKFLIQYTYNYYSSTDQVHNNSTAADAWSKSMAIYLETDEITDEIVELLREEYRIEKSQGVVNHNIYWSLFENDNVKNNIKGEFDDRLFRGSDWLSSEMPIATIVDWLKSPLRENEETDLSKYKTYEDAYDEAEIWHKELKAGGFIEEEHGKVIMSFDDGWYWIDLETTEDLEEAEAMGHCGTTSEGTTLLSLRKRKQPHVTMSINIWSGDDNTITQCKGRNNKKPIEKYHKYIVEIIKKLDLDSFFLEYDTGDDFSIDDLNNDLYYDLIKHKPTLLDEDFDIQRFMSVFKDDLEILKRLPNLVLLNILISLTENEFVDEETGDVVKVDRNFKNVLKTVEENIDFGRDKDSTKLSNGNITITRGKDKVFLGIKFVETSSSDNDRSYTNSMAVWDIYDILLGIDWNIENDYKDVLIHTKTGDYTTSKTFDLAIKNNDKNIAKNIQEIAKEYDKEIHIPKLKEEQSNLKKFIGEFGIKNIRTNGGEVSCDIEAELFFTIVRRELENNNWGGEPRKLKRPEDLVVNFRENIAKKAGSNKYHTKYDIIKEFNEYVRSKIEQKSEIIKEDIENGLLSWRSSIDKQFMAIVFFKTYKDYDVVKKMMGINDAVTTEEKQIFIDGEKLGELSMDKINFIEAHEIAHHYLEHDVKFIPEQEKEADYLAYLMLDKLGYKKSAELVIKHFQERHGEEFKEYEERAGKYIELG